MSTVHYLRNCLETLKQHYNYIEFLVVPCEYEQFSVYTFCFKLTAFIHVLKTASFRSTGIAATDIKNRPTLCLSKGFV